MGGSDLGRCGTIGADLALCGISSSVHKPLSLVVVWYQELRQLIVNEKLMQAVDNEDPLEVAVFCVFLFFCYICMYLYVYKLHVFFRIYKHYLSASWQENIMYVHV